MRSQLYWFGPVGGMGMDNFITGAAVWCFLSRERHLPRKSPPASPSAAMSTDVWSPQLPRCCW